MGNSVRFVRGTAYGDAKSSCAPAFGGVRRSAAAPDLFMFDHVDINIVEDREFSSLAALQSVLVTTINDDKVGIMRGLGFQQGR